MKITYLITAHNETNNLDALLTKLVAAHQDGAVDQILVLLDNPTPETQAIVDKWDAQCYKQCCHIGAYFHQMEHSLSKDYATHKNYPFSDVKLVLPNQKEHPPTEDKEYVFQIDADEMPSNFLVSNDLKELLQNNPDTELFWLPRINDYVGVTPEIAAQWGWNINNENKWVNWHSGDYQGRIYRRHLKWFGKLHERIIGNTTYAFLPKEEQFALYHYKPIEKQISTNMRYNQEFSEQDNKGHSLV